VSVKIFGDKRNACEGKKKESRALRDVGTAKMLQHLAPLG
jgi:hypothetical protein